MIAIFMCVGCDSKNVVEELNIYSTVYPITYLAETLYDENVIIDSIYPDDANIKEYELTKKQIHNYAKDADIFIYSGVSGEKEIAKEFVNKNNKLTVLDVAHGLKVDNSIEELWLSPSNYLMLAKNIKDNLFLILDNQYDLDKIEANYTELYESLSLLDADLRKAGEEAKTDKNNVLVVTSKAFKFLENYGFNVISLDEETYQTDEMIAYLGNNFKDGDYLTLINEYGKSNETVNYFIDDCKANSIDFSTFNSSNSDLDYLDALKNFIYNLEILISE